MSKAALREQRRAERIAQRNRQRTLVGVAVVLVIVAIIYFAYRDYASKLQPTTQNPQYLIGQLDATPPAPTSKAVTTASGLIYEDLQVGDGTAAKTGDTVTVNYTGWLADGTKFDSSIDRNQTFDFPIGGGKVIPGWDEGVVGMKVNGTRLLVIPPSLAYGASGSGPIPPNATITFEVQLVAIK
jgi:FKBP-type peptidyl-prolyl cis-trans isomerase